MTAVSEKQTTQLTSGAFIFIVGRVIAYRAPAQPTEILNVRIGTEVGLLPGRADGRVSCLRACFSALLLLRSP